MELYFKLKLISDFLLPFIIFAIIIIITFIKLMFDNIRCKRIENFFNNNGYERRLFSVSSVGGICHYGWRREADGRSVWEKDLKGMTVRQIKRKYK